MKTDGMKTHYETLDIPTDASPEQIRKAFRSLAFVYHPDLAGPDSMTQDVFLQIRQAYEVLIDDGRRSAYDEGLSQARQPDGQRQQTATRIVNVERPEARQYYSPVFAEQRLTRPVDAELLNPDNPVPRRPCDISGSIEISLEETLRPTSFTIILPDNPGAAFKGRLHVRLPGRIFRDAVLRVPKYGMMDGAERGDLFIETVFAAHPNFRVCAESLFYDMPLMPWQASLGFEAVIPTLEGFERVPMSPILSTPSIRRLPGKGIYKRNGERGDLWINLKLEVPPPTSFRARRLWAELADEYRHSQKDARSFN
ncbi:MAG: DnaJ C-terminal domain-containing protein [Opitutales bacterium]|jgi:curved DNA-binding protein